MHSRLSQHWFGLLIALAAGLIELRADAQSAPPPPLPFLSPIFADHMVLQRDKPNHFWGWTEPGRTVKTTIEGNFASTTAGPDGKWSITLTVPPAGGPYTVKISGPQEVTLNDVLVGDVWLCGCVVDSPT